MSDFIEQEEEKKYYEAVDRMRDMRMNCEVSQERLAKLCGISRQYLNGVENYKRIVPERQIQKLCMAIRQEMGEEPLDIILDYFRVRMPTQEIRMVLEEILRIRMEHFLYLDFGYYGYAGQYIFGNITVMVSPKKENGVLIELKGQGCREFERILEAQERSWYQFMREIINKNGVFKRLDIAINDKFGMLDIPKLTEKCKKGEIETKFNNFEPYGSGQFSRLREENKAEMGDTLYLGSKKSDIHFCIYAKDYEQMIKNGVPLAEAEIKNRFEIRLKDDRAELAVLDLTDHEEPGLTAFGIINQYVRFLKPEKGKKKRSWSLDKEWLAFIGNEEKKLKLTVKPEPYSVDRTRKWHAHQVAPTSKMLKEIDRIHGKTTTEDAEENAKLKEKHLKIIEQEKLMADQQNFPLDEIIL